MKKVCKCEVCNQTLFFFDEEQIYIKCKRCKCERVGLIQRLRECIDGFIKF